MHYMITIKPMMLHIQLLLDLNLVYNMDTKMTKQNYKQSVSRKAPQSNRYIIKVTGNT